MPTLLTIPRVTDADMLTEVPLGETVACPRLIGEALPRPLVSGECTETHCPYAPEGRPNCPIC